MGASGAFRDEGRDALLDGGQNRGGPVVIDLAVGGSLLHLGADQTDEVGDEVRGGDVLPFRDGGRRRAVTQLLPQLIRRQAEELSRGALDRDTSVVTGAAVRARAITLRAFCDEGRDALLDGGQNRGGPVGIDLAVGGSLVGPQNPIPSCGDSMITMMETSEHRDRRHYARALHGARTLWSLELQRPVGAGGVVVGDVFCHHPAQMPLVQRDDVVKTLAPERADPAFRTPFAWGAQIGVSTVSMPMRRARAMKSRP